MQNPDPNEDAVKPVGPDGLATQYIADNTRLDDPPLDSSTVNDTNYDPLIPWNAANFTSSNSNPLRYPIDSQTDTKGASLVSSTSSYLEGTRDEPLSASNTSIFSYAPDDPSAETPHRTVTKQRRISQSIRDPELTTHTSSKRSKPESGSDEEDIPLSKRIKSDHSDVNLIAHPDGGFPVSPRPRHSKWVHRDSSLIPPAFDFVKAVLWGLPRPELSQDRDMDLHLLPKFAQSLYAMVQDPRGKGLVYWTSDGSCFVFKTTPSFVSQVLKIHFQTWDLQTLVKQLERHGFYQRNQQQTPHLYGDSSLEFSHPKFLRGRPELLVDITANSQEVTPARPVAVSSAGPPLIRGSFRSPPPNSTLSYKVDELVDQTTENHKLTPEIKSLGQQLEEERAENNALREMLKRLTGSVKKTIDSPLEMDQMPSPSPQAPLSNEISGYPSISGPSWQPVDSNLHGAVNAIEYIQPVGGPMDSGTEVLHKATDPVAAENTDRLRSRFKTRTFGLIQSFTPRKGGK